MASDNLDQDVNTLNSLEQTFCSKANAYNENTDEWNSLRDKNDNLELETAPADTAEKVCRTCFNLVKSDSYLTIDAAETLIKMCLPKIDLLLTKDPVVCQKCYAKLQEFYGFSVECMTAENELTSYCAANQISGPINIYDFLKHTLKPCSNLVAVKQEDYPLGPVLDIDNGDNDLETLSHDIDVKSEDTNSDFTLNESSNAVKRPRKLLRKVKKTSKKKLKIRVGKKHFSSDLVETQVKCETCGQKFTSKWALDRHTPVHNSKNTNYYCESCNLKFKYKHSFNKHMSAHLSGVPPTKPFACECGKFFNRKSKLKKHEEIHIKKEKPFACKSCGKRFIDEKLLDSHVERVHISEKAFSCELCGNKYTSKAGLDVHFKSHFPSDNPRPEPDLMCDICGKLFYRKYSLEKHRMSHTGDKPHECDQCSMKFKERYQLTIHMRRHTGEKPFKCEVCSFKFPSKNRLGVHMRTHTGVRPFPCQLCDMAFTRNDHLIKHVRAIHTGERPFECDICSKTFNRKDYLLKHKKVHFKRSI